MAKNLPLTVGAVAEHFGIARWQIRRAIERRFLAEPRRIGAFRIFQRSDLPRIKVALRKAGYLPGAARASA